MSTSNSGTINIFDWNDPNFDWSKLSITSSNTISITDSITNTTNQQFAVVGSSKFDGNVEIKGKLEIGGVDIGDSLSRIEQRLAILRPNPRLEAEWKELKDLGERYRQLEAELLSGEELLRILRDP